MEKIFQKADILIPAHQLEKWSVVACDQYTSQEDYWSKVKQTVGNAPSSLNVIFPEVYLDKIDFDKKIASINNYLNTYIKDGIFNEYKDCYIYVERTLANKKVRKGIIGKFDLEHYSFEKGSQPAIRATEGTVLERIPPRVKIRKDAPLELPHVMVLIDDIEKKIIEPLSEQADEIQKIYDFELMMNSGSIKGYKLTDSQAENVDALLAQLCSEQAFEDRYSVSGKPVLAYAVGDGNHSLATAKQCYENLKAEIGEEKAKQHPARYALAELVNLHDDSLEFEAIHRIVTGVDPQHLLLRLTHAFDCAEQNINDNTQHFSYVLNSKVFSTQINNPEYNLAVGNLQHFLDSYIAQFGGKVDYIHGEDVVKSLSKQPDSVGFILPCMKKTDLFKTVILDGALPRKTFSMGEACDKRFYLEARKITE